LLQVHPNPPGVLAVASGVLGGPPDRTVRAGAFAIRLARLPPGLRLSPHAHEPATLNVVLDGEYRESIERGALRSHGPATLIAKPSGTVHANQVGSAPVECLVIELGPDAVVGVVVQRSAGIARWGGKLRAELVRRDDFSRLAAEGLVLELLGELAPTSPPRPEATTRLTRARDLLHDEPGPTSLGELARHVGLHPIYLARAFRSRFGCTVGEYARCLRVERARRLLHHPRYALSEVAARAGYSDQSHLTRDFRRAFNHTPAAYRRLARQVP
jgi:AraC family transcriptional regulator